MKEVKRLESENIHLNNDLQKSKVKFGNLPLLCLIEGLGRHRLRKL